MIHSIEQQLAALGRHARRLLIVYALAWVVGAALLVAIVLGLADFLFRFDDRGVRIIASLAAVGAVSWVVVQYLLPALRYRPSSVELAQHVEQIHPELHGRLASAIEFLHQSESDPTAGSAELRRVAISETNAAIDGLNWAAVVDARPVKRAALLFGVVALLAVSLATLFPRHAVVALQRLVNPLGNAHWPRQYHLAIREPVRRIAAGQPFELAVIDEGEKLPDAVFIQYRTDSPAGSTLTEAEKMEFVSGAMVAHKDSVLHSFEYRVFGGDDDTMPWTAVEVVEPPQVESLRIVVAPPSYTGYTDYESPERIEALVGSTLKLRGKVTRPVARLTLMRGQHAAVEATLSADGQSFTLPAAAAPLVVDESSPYRFELIDRQGLKTASDGSEIRAVADSPPTVVLERPAAGLFVTPTAAVLIQAVVKDNLAVRSVSLVYNRTDQVDQGDQRIELFVGPEAPRPSTKSTPVTAPGDSRQIEYRWDLASLNLPPGTQLTCFVSADDYQPKTGVSTARRITVVTPTALEERLGAQQASILAELTRILKLERDIRSQTAGIQEQIVQIGALPKPSSDQMPTAELNQRQVRRSLVSRTDGVLAQIAGVTAELDSNRLDSPELSRRLQQMASTIEELEREPLPIIERELTRAVKESKLQIESDLPTANAAITDALTAAGDGQDKVIVALEQLIDELTEWSHYRGLARDIGQIRQEQATLHERTQQIGAETIAREAQNLSPQQRADLNTAARSESDLAARLNKLLMQMQRIVQQATDDSQPSAEAVADSLHLAREQNLAGRIREVAEQVAGNRIGQALEQQTAILHGLDEMLDKLANRQEQQLSRLVKKLRDAEQQLEQIRQQQEGLQKKLELLTKQSQQPGANQAEIKQQLERLQREQRKLQQETERLAKQLQRLQAEKAAQSTAGAASEMNRADKDAAQGKQPDALDDLAKAKQDLDEAQQQLAERRRQAEQELAHEQLAKIGDALKSLADRQSRIVDETLAYDAQRKQPTGLTRAQSQSVLDLGRTEATLSAESTALAEKVAAAEVFQLALEQAAAEMKGAADRLAQLDTGSATQLVAGNALRRLQQIVEALRSDPNSNPPQPNDGGRGREGGGAGGAGNQPPADKIALLAEVKLLKMLQEQVNLRTKQLDEATRGQPMLTADQRREYIELAREQGNLAELIAKKAAPPAAPPEENPESLPDTN